MVRGLRLGHHPHVEGLGRGDTTTDTGATSAEDDRSIQIPTHREKDMLSVLEKSMRMGCLAMNMRPFSRKYSSPWTALTLALIPLRP